MQEPAQERPEARAIVRSIRVEGNRRYTDQQIISAYGQRIGEPLLDAEASRAGIELLLKSFRVRVFADFRPLGPRLEDGVELRLTVSELSVDLEPRFIGNVEVDRDDLLEWAGLEEGEELYLYKAPRVRERLLRRYRSEGFYFVEIEVVERPGGTDPETGEELVPDVIFEIKEGKKVKVKDVVLHGNESLPDRGFFIFKRGLRKLAGVELRKPLFFGLFAKKLDRETLDADILALREVYRDYGYLDAVVELERLEFNEDRDRVTIHIAIDEGGRFTVGSLSIEGVELFEDPNAPQGYGERPAELFIPEEELLELVKQKPGEVFQRRFQNDDERELRRRYGQLGYIDHQTLPAWDRWRFLDPELVFEADQPVVHVTYRLAQGRQIFIREIQITGNLHTQDRVIRRQLEVEPGQLADLEKIERSRSRVQSTGFFSDPGSLGHIEPIYRFKDTGDPSWKDLEFAVEEGQVLQFNLAGGISSNQGAFGVISLRQRNFDVTNLPSSPWSLIGDIANREAFHGAGQEFLIEAAPGTEVSRFRVSFVEPDIFRRHRERIGLGVSVFRVLRAYDSHDEERLDYGFELTRQVGLDAGLYTGFRTGEVKVDDFDVGGEPTLGNPFTVPRALKEQEGTNDLAYASLGFRLRAVDNYIAPRNGFGFTFDNKFYGSAIGSDFDFVRHELNVDWWDEFDEDPDVVSAHYHLEVGAGVSWAFGDTDATPYTERYFLGGQRTLRGFQFRGVGPNENGFPIGGQTMLYGTAEYRMPLIKQIQPGTYRELEQVQIGAFIDWGILDPERLSLDTDELRVSAGILFGISIPLPITFSFGWPIREGEGDETRVLGFNIGF